MYRYDPFLEVLVLLSPERQITYTCCCFLYTTYMGAHLYLLLKNDLDGFSFL